jgi:hypothetical protein
MRVDLRLHITVIKKKLPEVFKDESIGIELISSEDGS